MSRYCLDTSAYSYFKRGDPQVVELIERADWLGMPIVTIGELWSGFLQGSQRTRNRSELQEFLRSQFVEVLPVDESVAEIYADIVSDLKRKARPLPTNDIWIGAIAARTGAPVLTYDPHFQQMARVGTLVLTRADGG